LRISSGVLPAAGAGGSRRRAVDVRRLLGTGPMQRCAGGRPWRRRRRAGGWLAG
jgi:hypothetical protein